MTVKLVGALARAAQVVRSTPLPSILLSPDYKILEANRAYRERYAPDIQLGKDQCHWISHRYKGPCDMHGETCPLKQCLLTDAPARVLHVHHCTDGPEHVDVGMHPVRDDNGSIVAFIEVMETVDTQTRDTDHGALIGATATFNRVLGAIRRVGPSNLPVLLLGESGTGKELFARKVHRESERRNGPFIPVECSGLTESLFESELFGHEAGAFTGARHRKPGLVESARGGTLFLDEIAEIPAAQQVKLLRLLESGSYRRVGSVELQRADFRLVCATHQPLEKAVEEGKFRLDLFYRINTFPINIPALRERKADLPALCRYFLRGSGKSLSAAAERVLQGHDFPGNIRELRNILHRASLLADGTVVDAHHLGIATTVDPAFSGDIVTLEQAERDYLRWALRHHQGDRSELASLLGVSERTLYRKLATLEGDEMR